MNPSGPSGCRDVPWLQEDTHSHSRSECVGSERVVACFWLRCNSWPRVPGSQAHRVDVLASCKRRDSADWRWLQMSTAWAHLPMMRARRVLTAVSNGRVLRCTWASRSPPWSVASRVVARSSGSMSDGSFPSAWRDLQSIADGGCPLIEPGRDERSGLGVALGELTTERTKWAAALCLGCASPR